MGIKNLHKILRKHCEDIYIETHLSSYAFKKIAIDISLYMFKYKTIFRERWLDAFINLVACLRKNEIHCVFVYDNGSPVEKQVEKDERIKTREKTRDRMKTIENDIKRFHSTGDISECIQDIYDKSSNDIKVQRLLSNKVVLFDVSVVERKLEKMKQQDVHITKYDFELTKELFEIIGVPWILADGEAEMTCSHMCLSGIVDGVLSEDTDVLAYNTPLFLTKINTSNETCVEIKIENILESLEMTYDTFRDLCIMCGTDYNKNIPKVGPHTSFKLLTEHKTIENIKENTKYDVSILNHNRSRELFTLSKDYCKNIPYCSPPKWNELKRFLFTNNCRTDVNHLETCFAPKQLVFSD